MTGLIPRPFIDELIVRTDIVEFIDGYFPLKKQGSSFVACCPFHQEKTPSFNVIAKKQYYYCFGCGASGNVISFVMHYLNQTFRDAVETLASRAGLQIPHEGGSVSHTHSQSYYQLLDQVTVFYQRALKYEGSAGSAYLHQRGIDGVVLQNYQLGYAPSAWHALCTHFRGASEELMAMGLVVKNDAQKRYDRFRHRVMFPIHDVRGHVIGFGGRVITAEQKPKYLNSPETVVFQKNKELYGLYQALKHAPLQSIIVVEGYMDVLALAQHGIHNAVATLGTATSIYHIQRLAKYTKQIIFCFDGDNAGRKAAWRALENAMSQLDLVLDIRFVFLPEGHDPDSLVRHEGKDAFMVRLNHALPLHQFFFETLMHEIDMSTLPGRSQLFNAAKAYLTNAPECAYKQLLLDELTRMTHIDQQHVHRLVGPQVNAQLKTNTNEMTSLERTPQRIASALLIQHPELYRECKSSVPVELVKDLGHPILDVVFQSLEKNPDRNTAQLVEGFRNTKFYKGVSYLAVWDHRVPEDALAKELTCES